MKQHTKRTYIALFCISLFCMGAVGVGIVHAQVNSDLGLGLVGDVATRGGFDASTNETTLAETVGRFVRALLSLTGILFTVLAVYAGIMWMTARGDQGRVEQAQKILQNSLIGLVIAVSAYAITGFVMQAVISDKASRTSPTVPTTDDTLPLDETVGVDDDGYLPDDTSTP